MKDMIDKLFAAIARMNRLERSAKMEGSRQNTVGQSQLQAMRAFDYDEQRKLVVDSQVNADIVKRRYKEGDRITDGQYEGEIASMDGKGVTLRFEDGSETTLSYSIVESGWNFAEEKRMDDAAKDINEQKKRQEQSNQETGVVPYTEPQQPAEPIAAAQDNEPVLHPEIKEVVLRYTANYNGKTHTRKLRSKDGFYVRPDGTVDWERTMKEFVVLLKGEKDLWGDIYRSIRDKVSNMEVVTPQRAKADEQAAAKAKAEAAAQAQAQAQAAQQEQQQAEQQQAEQQQEQRWPVKKDGTPDFNKMTPQQEYDYNVENYGEETAQKNARAYIERYQNAIKNIQSQLDSRNGTNSITAMEYRLRENQARLEAWRGLLKEQPQQEAQQEQQPTEQGTAVQEQSIEQQPAAPEQPIELPQPEQRRWPVKKDGTPDYHKMTSEQEYTYFVKILGEKSAQEAVRSKVRRYESEKESLQAQQKNSKDKNSIAAIRFALRQNQARLDAWRALLKEEAAPAVQPRLSPQRTVNTITVRCKFDHETKNTFVFAEMGVEMVKNAKIRPFYVNKSVLRQLGYKTGSALKVTLSAMPDPSIQPWLSSQRTVNTITVRCKFDHETKNTFVFAEMGVEMVKNAKIRPFCVNKSVLRQLGYTAGGMLQVTLSVAK